MARLPDRFISLGWKNLLIGCTLGYAEHLASAEAKPLFAWSDGEEIAVFEALTVASADRSSPGASLC